jgi:hypothetical protein
MYSFKKLPVRVAFWFCRRLGVRGGCSEGKNQLTPSDTIIIVDTRRAFPSLRLNWKEGKQVVQVAIDTLLFLLEITRLFIICIAIIISRFTSLRRIPDQSDIETAERGEGMLCLLP